MRLVRPGKWELRVSVGRWDNGRPRSFTRTVPAKSKTAAANALAEFVEEMTESSLPKSRDLRDLTMDEAMERFLTEYLAEERPKRPLATTATSTDDGSPLPSDPRGVNRPGFPGGSKPWKGRSHGEEGNLEAVPT